MQVNEIIETLRSHADMEVSLSEIDPMVCQIINMINPSLETIKISMSQYAGISYLEYRNPECGIIYTSVALL